MLLVTEYTPVDYVHVSCIAVHVDLYQSPVLTWPHPQSPLTLLPPGCSYTERGVGGSW